MLALPASARMMGQSARKNLYLVHPVHVALLQSNGSGISCDEWNSKNRQKLVGSSFTEIKDYELAVWSSQKALIIRKLLQLHMLLVVHKCAPAFNLQ